jgi:hypothetical protein
MQEVYFLTRHIPFWAIPLTLVSLELAYMFWLKKKKSTVLFFLTVAAIGLISVSFYVWVGGPEKGVKYLKKAQQNYQ